MPNGFLPGAVVAAMAAPGRPQHGLNVDVDERAQTVTITEYRALAIHPTVITVPFALVKTVFYTILGLELGAAILSRVQQQPDVPQSQQSAASPSDGRPDLSLSSENRHS